MKKLILVFFCFLTIASYGQNNAITNDTVLVVRLKEVDVTGNYKWKNDTVRYRYNQMRYYVTTILPYLNAATKLFNEINAELNDPNVSRKDRKHFINTKEKEMRTQFEDKVKELNVTQGVLLVKLIGRQTGLDIYKMLNEFKNPLVAIKWQAWARLNGMNLNKQYDPSAEPDLESIMESLNYPLPGFYTYGPNVSKN